MTKKEREGQGQRTSESTSEGAAPSPSGSEEERTEDSSSRTDGQGSEGAENPEEITVGAAEGAPDFQHPLLKGKSPEEIERLFQTQEQAVREQNEELNRLHQQTVRASQAEAPRPQREEEEDPYGDDFLAPRFKKFEERLTKALDDRIEPLKRETQARGAQTARERLRGQLRHFSVLEPHIDKLLRDQGAHPETATEAQLTMLYHTAVGLAAERGVNLERATGETEAPAPRQPASRQPEKQPVNIPQHRPSSAPLPSGSDGRPAPRQLTEAERRLAREYFPGDSEAEKKYRQLQDAEIDEIVQPGFSKENW